jgi:hypothetical protein
MFDHGDKELEDLPATTPDPKLVLDGTVNLDYSSDDETPRVKGLIELINEYVHD